MDQRIVDAHGHHHGAAADAGDDIGQANHHAPEDLQHKFHQASAPSDF